MPSPRLAVRVLTPSALALVALSANGTVAQELQLWSHWADHETKVQFVEEAVRRFEEEHPDASVKISWYQKPPLQAALAASLQAGEGPDIFYCEPGWSEYVENGLLRSLDEIVDWTHVQDWARGSWTFNGTTYGFPLEVSTVELYYDRDQWQDLGLELPQDKQLDQEAFKEVVKKAADAGITPIVQGVGDRPYPGAYVIQETLLKKLGKDDYGKLVNGELSFKDPRVVEAFQFVKDLVDMGAYPKSFSTLKLGESHYYFHTNPGGLLFPMGSWYTSRAFNPPDKGGQPEDFPLGIMRFPEPADAACPECKTLNVAGSYCVNADSEYPELAGAVLNEMATPEMGTKWLTTVLVQTGVESDASAITGKYKPYFDELTQLNQDAEYFIGAPLDFMKGQCGETFTQVMNAAFPAGQVSVEQATDMMDAACYQGG
jgi:multiple sugar transport system substrate-binding protein